MPPKKDKADPISGEPAQSGGKKHKSETKATNPPKSQRAKRHRANPLLNGLDPDLIERFEKQIEQEGQALESEQMQKESREVVDGPDAEAQRSSHPTIEPQGDLDADDESEIEPKTKRQKFQHVSSGQHQHISLEHDMPKLEAQLRLGHGWRIQSMVDTECCTNIVLTTCRKRKRQESSDDLDNGEEPRAKGFVTVQGGRIVREEQAAAKQSRTVQSSPGNRGLKRQRTGPATEEERVGGPMEQMQSGTKHNRSKQSGHAPTNAGQYADGPQVPNPCEAFRAALADALLPFPNGNAAVLALLIVVLGQAAGRNVRLVIPDPHVSYHGLLRFGFEDAVAGVTGSWQYMREGGEEEEGGDDNAAHIALGGQSRPSAQQVHEHLQRGEYEVELNEASVVLVWVPDGLDTTVEPLTVDTALTRIIEHDRRADDEIDQDNWLHRVTLRRKTRQREATNGAGEPRKGERQKVQRPHVQTSSAGAPDADSAQPAIDDTQDAVSPKTTKPSWKYAGAKDPDVKPGVEPNPEGNTNNMIGALEERRITRSASGVPKNEHLPSVAPPSIPKASRKKSVPVVLVSGKPPKQTQKPKDPPSRPEFKHLDDSPFYQQAPVQQGSQHARMEANTHQQSNTPAPRAQHQNENRGSGKGVEDETRDHADGSEDNDKSTRKRSAMPPNAHPSIVKQSLPGVRSLVAKAERDEAKKRVSINPVHQVLGSSDQASDKPLRFPDQRSMAPSPQAQEQSEAPTSEGQEDEDMIEGSDATTESEESDGEDGADDAGTRTLVAEPPSHRPDVRRVSISGDHSHLITYPPNVTASNHGPHGH